jgi:outer membrane protein insertion porin family
MPLTGGRKGLVCLSVLVALGAGAGGAFAQAPQLITAVQVLGNDYISQDVILADVAGILDIGGPFTAQKAQAARQAVMREGYFDEVTVSTRAATGGVDVVITVVERKRIEKILFVGNSVVSDDQLRDAIISKVGHVIDPRVIRRDVTNIEALYRKLGYIAKVTDPTVDELGTLTFVVNELKIERIDITGLKATKEWVVRRQIKAKPGEIFREQDIARDHQRIFALDIFESVTPDLREGQENPLTGIIVEFKMKEKPTGMASFALAYSNLDKLVVMLSLQDSNLRGRAERGAITLELLGRASYDVRFFEPFLDKKGTTVDVSLFDSERTRRFVGGAGVSIPDDRFDERRVGGTLKFTRPTSEMDRVSLAFRDERVSSSFLEGRQVISPGIGSILTAQTGTRPPSGLGGDPLREDLEPGTGYGPIVVAAPLHPGGRVAAVTLGWTHDARVMDKLKNARSGVYWGTSWETAGSILGGEQTFNQLDFECRTYRPVTERDVIAVRLKGGASFGGLPLFESFTVGGADSLRGYSEDRFRGRHMVLANLEFRHSISDKFGAVAFVDIGDAFGGEFKTIVPGFTIPAEDTDLSVHVGAGVGLRAETPLGPIRLDFGWGSDGNEVHFGFGQIF